MYIYVHTTYAGIALPQVLQYLREFDVPAMQSCKTTALWYRFLTEPKAKGANPNQKPVLLW